ncbi:hypothetical protein niasHS_013823 [Heterodera schachtii]|uniref:Probable pectate lyase F n=1 Tax=Heterodera schachtii TaxID=97005 RepID=A0ABD2ILK4_HETSC
MPNKFQEGFYTGVCTFPPSPSSQLVPDTQPILTDTDFGFTTFVGGPGILGGGECKVNNWKMKYMFDLADGVTIKNAILDTPGMGTYCRGTCTLENIFYKRLCYHAAGFGFEDINKEHTYKVIGGGGIGSPDKYFTQSGRGKTQISGFCGDGAFGKLYCSCGDCPDQVERSVKVSDIKMRGPGLTIVSVNKRYSDTASLSGIQLYGQDSQDTMVDYICQTYLGQSDRHPQEEYAPNEDGQGPCGYSTSQVALETAGAASSTPRQQVPTAGGPPGAAGQTPKTAPTAGGPPGAAGQTPKTAPTAGGPPGAAGQTPKTAPTAGGPPGDAGYPTYMINPSPGKPYNQFPPYTKTPQHALFPHYFGSASSRLPRPLFSSSLWDSSTFYVCLLISLFVLQIPNTLMLHHNDQYVEIDSKYLSCDPVTNHAPAEDDEEEEDEEGEVGYYCKFTVRLEQQEGNKCASKALDFGEIGGAHAKDKSRPIDQTKDSAKKSTDRINDNAKKGPTDQKDNAKKRITDQKDISKNGPIDSRKDSAKKGPTDQKDNAKKRITDQKDISKNGPIDSRKDSAKNGPTDQRKQSAKNSTDRRNDNTKKRITDQRKDNVKKRSNDQKKG